MIINQKGFYGSFGGNFIPELLKYNIENIRKKYKNIINNNKFQKEFKHFLYNYVGRPSPLFYSKKLSYKYKTKIYLKREDLNHTGAHKINNTIGQALLAKKLGKKKNYCRNWCWTTWISHCNCLCYVRNGLYYFYGKRRF